MGKTSMLSRKTSKRLFTWVSSDQYYNAFIGYLTCRPRQIFLMSFHLWYLKSTTRVKPLKETKSSNNTRANMHPFLAVYIPIQIFWQGLWRIIRECTMSFLCTVYVITSKYEWTTIKRFVNIDCRTMPSFVMNI